MWQGGGALNGFAMNSLPLSLATFACCLSLALPPGWCCMLAPAGPGQAGAADQAATQADDSTPVARRSCCHRGVTGPHTGPVPVVAVTLMQPVGGCVHQSDTPQVRCCCTRDAVVREQAVKVAVDILPVAQVAEAEPLPVATRCFPAQRVFPPPGLALHVLQCVWLC